MAIVQGLSAMHAVQKYLFKNQTVLGIVAFAVIGFAGWRIITVGFGAPQRHPDSIWLYDITSDRLYAGDADQIPPITSSNGAVSVEAQVFSCSDCADSSNYKIGVLFKYSDKMKEVLTRGATEADDSVLMNRNSELSASVEMAKAGKWEPAQRSLQQIFEKAVEVCEGNYTKCYP